MKNTKTFWSVNYNGFGFDRVRTAWFANKEDAVKFANHDYRDKPVRHTVINPETIKDYNERVEMTRYEFE